jgi:hypothetical protein
MKILLLACFIIFSIASKAQSKTYRIVITPNDSVYLWKGNTGDELFGFSTVDNAIVMNFSDSDRTISEIHSMCGRGDCPDGISISFHNNGVIASKGTYGFTTDIDSLKYAGGDGFYDNIEKDGYWYYWNDKGFLIKKQKWSKGKLINTIYYKTTVIPIRKKKKQA